MIARIPFVVLVAAMGCSKTSAPSAPPAENAKAEPALQTDFFLEFEKCSSGLRTLGAAPFEEKSFHAAWSACASLVGDGACRAAWDDLPSAFAKNDAKIGTRLSPLIEACGSQHCPSFSEPKPRACSSAKDWTPDQQSAVWAELHAAVLAKIFSDKIEVSASLKKEYGALPESPSAEQFKSLLAQLPTTASPPGEGADGVDGRAVVFGTVAKFISALALPSDTWASPRQLPAADPVPFVPNNPGISLLIVNDGAVVAAAGVKARKVSLCKTKLDTAGVTNALCDLRRTEKFAAGNTLEMAADDEVPYQMVVSAMDAAQQAGFSAVFTSRAELKVKVPANRRRIKAGAPSCGGTARCIATAPSVPVSPSAPAPPAPTAETAKKHMRALPIIIITATELKLGETTIASLKDLPKNRDALIKPLQTALKQRQQRIRDNSGLDEAARKYLTTTVIVQADKDTTAKVLGQISATADKVGYSELLFAVKRR